VKDVCCVACGYFGIVDRAHIKSKGAGGTMDESNILLFCRGCHATQHRLGFRLMCERFPSVAAALKEKGWKFVNEFGRSKLVRAK
jgi:hypothetical protein